MDEKALHSEEPMPNSKPESSVSDRWLSALCYIGPAFLLAIFRRNKSSFLHWHVRQGFCLFFLEAILMTLLLILDQTVGRIPILGFILMILLQLAFFLTFLSMSAIGFVKSLAGENMRIPWIEDYAEKIPLDPPTHS